MTMHFLPVLSLRIEEGGPMSAVLAMRSVLSLNTRATQPRPAPAGLLAIITDQEDHFQHLIRNSNQPP